MAACASCTVIFCTVWILTSILEVCGLSGEAPITVYPIIKGLYPIGCCPDGSDNVGRFVIYAHDVINPVDSTRTCHVSTHKSTYIVQGIMEYNPTRPGSKVWAYYYWNAIDKRWLWRQKDLGDTYNYWFVGADKVNDVKNNAWIYRYGAGEWEVRPSSSVQWTEKCPLTGGTFVEKTFTDGISLNDRMDTYRCDACAPGKYKSSTAENVLCSNCPLGSTSVAQSTRVTDCKCMKGYFLQGTACVPCAQGTFKSTIGSESCTSCRSAETSVPQSIDAWNCSCKDGYGFSYSIPGQNCAACVAGSYNFFDPTRLTSTNCRTCPTHSTSVRQSSTCTCADGYLMTHPQSASPQCQACPTNSVCEVQSSGVLDCKCNAGFSGQNCETCNECIEGKFKLANGMAACTDCPPGTYSSLLAATSCSLCLVNTYNALSGATSCQLCPTGNYTPQEGATICQVCPEAYSARTLTASYASGNIFQGCIDFPGA